MPAQSVFHEGFHESDRRTMEMVLGGSGMEVLGGLVAILLAILGLAEIVPVSLAAVAVIALGVAFLAQGATVASRYTQLVERMGGSMHKSVDLARGITTEFVGGIAGIVFGVIALLGMAPLTMIAVALLVYGATLFLSSDETGRLGELKVLEGTEDKGHQFFHVAASAAPGGKILLGLGTMVLGILSLVMVGELPLTLALVGVLCVGAALLFSGTAIAGRLMSLFR